MIIALLEIPFLERLIRYYKMKYNKSELSELVTKLGIEGLLGQIDIENVEDDVLKIVLRTIKHSHNILTEQLQHT